MRMLRPWRLSGFFKIRVTVTTRVTWLLNGTKHSHQLLILFSQHLTGYQGGDRVRVKPRFFWCRSAVQALLPSTLSRQGGPSPPLTAGHQMGRALSWEREKRRQATLPLAGRNLAPHWESSEPQGSLAKDETWRWVPVKQSKPPLQLLTLTHQESA